MVGFGVAICPRKTDQSHFFFLSSGDNQKNTEKFPSE